MLMENRSPLDEEIELEFQDLFETLEQHPEKLPKVPGKLDRRVRQLAGLDPIKDLQAQWILGSGPLLVLVVLLLFSIGILFLFV